MPRVDCAGIDDVKVNQPLPAMNNVLVTITSAEIGEMKNGAIKAINWMLTLQEGDYQGRTVFHKTNFWVDPAELATWKQTGFDYRTPLKRFLEAVGATWDPTGFDTDPLLNMQLRVNVTQRTYEGDIFNDVKNPKPAEQPVS